SVYSSPYFQNPFGITPDQVQAIVDVETQNLAVTSVSGVDLHASYSFQPRVGRVTATADGTYLLHDRVGITATAPQLAVLNTIGHPVSKRMRSSLGWQVGSLSTTAFCNFTGRYTNNSVVPHRAIASWITFDFQVSLTTAQQSHGLLSGMTVALTGLNIFDRAPPFAENAQGLYPFGYDPTNANALGREVSLTLSKKW